MHLIKNMRGLIAVSVTATALFVAGVGMANAMTMVKVCYFNQGHPHICTWVPRP